MIIKTTALDFIQHLRPHFGSKSPSCSLRHLPVAVLVLWAGNDFQESCSAPLFGAGKWLMAPVFVCMLPTALHFLQCHPSRCERCSAITHGSAGTLWCPCLCLCLAILLTPPPWAARGKHISACLRSTIKGENKLADISF